MKAIFKDDNTIFIEIWLGNSPYQMRKVLVSLDTGFNKDVYISEEKAKELLLQPSKKGRIKLADETIVEGSLYYGYMSCDKVLAEVDIITHPNAKPHIGIGFFKKMGKEMIIDFVNKTVTFK